LLKVLEIYHFAAAFIVWFHAIFLRNSDRSTFSIYRWHVSNNGNLIQWHGNDEPARTFALFSEIVNFQRRKQTRPNHETLNAAAAKHVVHWKDESILLIKIGNNLQEFKAKDW